MYIHNYTENICIYLPEGLRNIKQRSSVYQVSLQGQMDQYDKVPMYIICTYVYIYTIYFVYSKTTVRLLLHILDMLDVGRYVCVLISKGQP